jgi:starvation-inducible DNA-binding protein
MTSTPTAPADSKPRLHQPGREIQAFGTVRQFPVALSVETRIDCCERLNRAPADTQIL